MKKKFSWISCIAGTLMLFSYNQGEAQWVEDHLNNPSTTTNTRLRITNVPATTTPGPGGNGLQLGLLNNPTATNPDNVNFGFLWMREDWDLRFYTDNQRRMYIKHDGNVGIGTANPITNLHVSDALGLDGLITSDPLSSPITTPPLTTDDGLVIANVDGTMNTKIPLTGNSGDVLLGTGVFGPAPGGGNDADWFVATSTAVPGAITDNIYTEGFVGIGDIFQTNNPGTKLHIRTNTIPGNVETEAHAMVQNAGAGAGRVISYRLRGPLGTSNRLTGGDFISYGRTHGNPNLQDRTFLISREGNEEGLVIGACAQGTNPTPDINFFVASNLNLTGPDPLSDYIVSMKHNKRVGINRFTPLADLHIRSNDNNTNGTLRLEAEDNSGPGNDHVDFITTVSNPNPFTINVARGGSTNVFGVAQSATTGVSRYNAYSSGQSAFIISTNVVGASYTGVNSAGGVIIGPHALVDPNNVNQNLYVTGNGFMPANVGAELVVIGRGNDGTTTNFWLRDSDGNSLFGVFDDGDATLAGNLTQGSDRRYKTNIQKLSGSLEKVVQLNGYNYNWKPELKRSTELQTGVIAQELEEIIPNLIKTGKDGYKSVNYIGLIPVLIEAIKEQQTEIEELKEQNTNSASDELAAMKAEIEALKELIAQNNVGLSVNTIDIWIDGKGKTIILDQNEPNPFRDRTTISYFIPNNVANAKIVIYDINGKLLQEENLQQGKGMVNVYASNLEDGMYTYSIIADGQVVETKKMMLTK